MFKSEEFRVLKYWLAIQYNTQHYQQVYYWKSKLSADLNYFIVNFIELHYRQAMIAYFLEKDIGLGLNLLR